MCEVTWRSCSVEAELLAVAVSSWDSWEGGERDEIRYFLLFILGIYNLVFLMELISCFS